MRRDRALVDSIEMNRGNVYVWIPDPGNPLGGRVVRELVPLLRLETDGEGNGRLWGRFVRVRNGGEIHEPDPATGGFRAVPVGDARPNARGDFVFKTRRGGGRLDKVALAEPLFRARFIEASHFGEVNTYYHL